MVSTATAAAAAAAVHVLVLRRLRLLLLLVLLVAPAALTPSPACAAPVGPTPARARLTSPIWAPQPNGTLTPDASSWWGWQPGDTGDGPHAASAAAAFGAAVAVGVLPAQAVQDAAPSAQGDPAITLVAIAVVGSNHASPILQGASSGRVEAVGQATVYVHVSREPATDAMVSREHAGWVATAQLLPWGANASSPTVSGASGGNDGTGGAPASVTELKGHGFGSAVAVQMGVTIGTSGPVGLGAVAAVGAVDMGVDGAGAVGPGAVYIFTCADPAGITANNNADLAVWHRVATLRQPRHLNLTPANWTRFGAALGLRDGVLVVGAPVLSSALAARYGFTYNGAPPSPAALTRNAAVWCFEAADRTSPGRDWLPAPDPIVAPRDHAHDGDLFGSTVDVMLLPTSEQYQHGVLVLVGAPAANVTSAVEAGAGALVLESPGAAFLYGGPSPTTSGPFALLASLLPPLVQAAASPGVRFGTTVRLVPSSADASSTAGDAGVMALVAAPGPHTGAGATAGKVYLLLPTDLARLNSTWSVQVTVAAPSEDADSAGGFGASGTHDECA